VTASETERRLAIARRIVSSLASRTELRASLLAGSVAQGIADEHSDIDLLNYYDSPPDGELFTAVVHGAGGEKIDDLRYGFDGIEVQTSGQAISELEVRLQRIETGDVDWITAKVAMGLIEGTALWGDELINQWKSRASYPGSLRRREVEANLGWFPIWRIDDHLAARDAELFRRQMLLEGAFRVLAVLSAINRLYFSTFQFKRATAYIDRMEIKPERLAERLDRVANAPPSDAADELRKLVDETKTIVRKEMPDIDPEVAWRPAPRAV
jgi:hypothetical protein